MSVAGDVADALVAAVRGLGLVKADAQPLAEDHVYRLKAPGLVAGKNPPAVVVTVGEEGEVEYLTAALVMVTYPAALTIVSGGGSTLADDETVRTWRQRLRRMAEAAATFAGVAGFNAVKATGRVPFEAAALKADLNYGVIVFAVEVTESRT